MFGNVIIKYKIHKSAYKNKIYYGSINTEFGQMYIAYYFENNMLHICCLHFEIGQTMGSFSNHLQKLWSEMLCEENNELAQLIFNKYFIEQQESEVYVVLNGTDFQMKVWAALLEIPYGEERTYGEVSEMVNSPKAVRAVASAIGSNNIAILIPCHRVKAKNGDVHKYRWGSELKKAILLKENKEK